jgi:mitogen-activated protein kinase 15
MWSVGCILG